MIIKTHLDYPEKTMFQMIESIAAQYPDEPAYEFYDIRTSFRDFTEKIEDAARLSEPMASTRGIG